MMAADSEQKFDAAVQVIRSLPKSGSFQPSHDMMLKFYGYYKQAKEGPCTEAKPSFWDMVKKAKWEAWSKLGNISKEDAMETYVNELKKVIEKMPETDQASQFLHSLEPFYKAAYRNKENAPPIFNIFHRKHSKQTNKMNGHIHVNGDLTSKEDIVQNGVDEHQFNTSQASFLHNIESVHVSEKELNGSVESASLCEESNNEEIREIKAGMPDIKKATESPSGNNHSRLTENKSFGDVNDNKDDDEEDEDDDDLFCDSLGPELLEQEVNRSELLHSDALESVQEDFVNIGRYGQERYSSLSDVEIIEQFSTKNYEDNIDESSTPNIEKITHVHFEDLSASLGEQKTAKNVEGLLRTNVEKECMIQPNQLGAGCGGGDERELLRATAERKQVQRNAPQQSDRPLRYGHRYRRRSQESDSDESPGRSDHNSSSERDDPAGDRIADLLIEIQDNMKKILERLKRVEDSLERNQNSWFENYKPSKTLIFLIIWPFIVNIIFRFLRRKRYNGLKKR